MSLVKKFIAIYTWEETDSGINISDDTGETIDGTLEDGVLTINLYGVEIKMEKE